MEWLPKHGMSVWKARSPHASTQIICPYWSGSGPTLWWLKLYYWSIAWSIQGRIMDRQGTGDMSITAQLHYITGFHSHTAMLQFIKHWWGSELKKTSNSLLMIRLWHGNCYSITGPLWGESTGDHAEPVLHNFDVFMSGGTNFCWTNSWSASGFLTKGL